MNCANCKYNDGLVYTSIPPKYRCTITNEFHLGFDDCDVEFTPVRHGRWVETIAPELWECSVCGCVIYSETEIDRKIYHKWCSKCGAKMDGDV